MNIPVTVSQAMIDHGPKHGEIRQAVGGVLSRSAYTVLRNVELEVEGESLILKGKVPTFYLKQVAQTLASQATASYRIVNELRVSG